MKKIAAFLLPFMVIACAKPWPKVDAVQTRPLEPTAAEWRTTDHLVVITDASGSVSREALLPEARAVAQSFIAGIPQGDVRAKDSSGYDASFIGFGGDARVKTELAPIEGANVLPAPNRTNLYSTAANLDALGSPSMGSLTPLASVLGEAGAVLEGKTGPAAVVVISDGRPDDAAASLEAGRALVAGYKDELCIHTVHVGDDAEGRAHLSQLAALSKDGCGSSREASSLNSVAALDDMQRKVFFGAAPPPVASAGPCDQRLVLRGVQFAFDSAKLTADSEPVLDVAVNHLKECTGTSLAIEGHTCSLGTETYNDGLSSRRAESVREYLVAHGVSADRLMAKGLGEAGPVATNDTKDGRAQNRRVELVPAK